MKINSIKLIEILGFISLVWLVVLVDQCMSQECICNAKFVGEYCGNELNEKSESGAGNCSSELIYFCGKSNMRKTAFDLRSCTEKGYLCNSKENKDNPCFQNLRCNCGDNNGRRKKYCGNDLVGPGCKSNIIYKCPLFRSSKLQVEDACPNGCENGKCIQ